MCPSRVPQPEQIASVIPSVHLSFTTGLSKIIRPVVLPKQMSSSQAGAAWAQFCLRRVPSLFGRKQWSRIAARITWFACPPPLPRCDQQWFEQPRSDPVSALSERVWLYPVQACERSRARGQATCLVLLSHCVRGDTIPCLPAPPAGLEPAIFGLEVRRLVH